MLLTFRLQLQRLLLRHVLLARKERQGELDSDTKVLALVVLAFTGTLPFLWYLVRTTDLQIVCPHRVPNSTVMCRLSHTFSFITVRLHTFVGASFATSGRTKFSLCHHHTMVTETKRRLNNRLRHIVTAIDSDPRLRGVRGIVSLPLSASAPPLSACLLLRFLLL